MPIRRRKDKTHLLMQARLRFTGRYYIHCYLWANRAAMVVNVPGIDMRTLACFAPERIVADSADQCWRSTPKIGEIHLVHGELGVGVVTHEIGHAMFHWALLAGMDLNAVKRGDAGPSEEAYCWEIGSLASQLWSAYYDWREKAGIELDGRVVARQN